MAESRKSEMQNTEQEKAQGNYTHKVGVKILSDVQLKNTLPTYEKLIARMEVCRDMAGSDQIPRGHYQYNFMYDNVFSVLGERGTGKTSVAFTLQKKIRENQKYEKYDVVLPLVIPEVIPEHCTVLGWLLAIVKEEMEQLEKRIQEHERKRPGEQYRSKYCFYGEENESLVTRLEEISHMFFAGSYNPSNDSSYYRAIGYSVQQAEDYYKFAKEIAHLWDLWIDRIKECYKLEQGTEDCPICPMIYFIFDDVDLAPEKISELLSVIIKYLSHPNIIVITTADEKLFLEVIENQLDQKIGRIPREYREYRKSRINDVFDFWDRDEKEKKRESEDVIDRTARMYLGKVLPPSTRYYLRLFHTAKQKEKFYVGKARQLGTAVCEAVDKLVETIDTNGCNFMKPDGTMINFYLRFVGYTSRQISNVYLSIEELISNMCQLVKDIKAEEKELEEESRREGEKRYRNYREIRRRADIQEEEHIQKIYQDCRYFLCVALNSNHDLTRVMADIEDFVDEVFLPEYNQWRLYINYPYINEYVEEVVGEELRAEQAAKVDIVLQIYSLFIFVENILLVMESAFRKGITGRKKVHAVSAMTEYIQRIAFDNRHIFRDDLEPDIFFEHYNNLLDRLKSIVADEVRSDTKFAIAYFNDFRDYKFKQGGGRQDGNNQSGNNQAGKEKEKLKDIVRRNPRWFNELVGMITMVYGNAYLFDKKDMANCLVFRDKKYQVRYQRKISNELQVNIGKCFEAIKLQEVWGEDSWKECRSRQYKEPDNKNSEFSNLTRRVTEQIIKMRQGEEREHLPVSLETVLETVFQCVKTDNFMDRGEIIASLLQQCQSAVAQEMINMLNGIESDPGVIKRLLADKIAYIEQIEYTWNNMGIVFNPTEVVDAIEQLFQINSSRYRELRRLGAEIASPRYTHNDLLPEQEQGRIAVLDRSFYRELLNALTRTMEQVRFNSYITPEEEAALNEVGEMLADWDICVDVYNEEAMRRAVSLGLDLLLTGLLQMLYIYQTIYERYQNNNSLSSRELEKLNFKNTYYYSLFGQIIELVEFDGKPERQASLKETIRLAFTHKRQKYVEQLIKEAKDE